MRSSLARMVFNWTSDRSLNGGDNTDGDAVRGRAFRCTEKHQWERLRNLLLHAETISADPEQLSRLAVPDTKDGRTLLHVVCANGPPLDVVTSVTRMFPAMLHATDRSNRTPLHEAVWHGASVKVVKSLIRSEPLCTMIKDAEGSTPLILACQKIGLGVAPGFDQYEDELYVEYACELVQELALSSPDSVLVEDGDGMNALEHALDREAPRKTIRILQHVTSRMTKKEDKAKDIERRRDDMEVQHLMCGEDSDASTGPFISTVTRNSIHAAGA